MRNSVTGEPLDDLGYPVESGKGYKIHYLYDNYVLTMDDAVVDKWDQETVALRRNGGGLAVLNREDVLGCDPG